MKLPSYFSVNRRPVKLVETEDGGMDVQALNYETGDFERQMKYLTRVTLSDTDTDELSKEEFDALVEEHRAEIAKP